jgi:hypothetical protein
VVLRGGSNVGDISLLTLSALGMKEREETAGEV